MVFTAKCDDLPRSESDEDSHTPGHRYRNNTLMIGLHLMSRYMYRNLRVTRAESSARYGIYFSFLALQRELEAQLDSAGE